MAEAVLNVFETKIFSGEFREGSSFSENDLLKDIKLNLGDGDDVSRTPRTVVRDALVSLTKVGLVEQKPRVGTRIQTFNSDAKKFALARRIFEEQLAVFHLIDSLEDEDDETNDKSLEPLIDAIESMKNALYIGSKPDVMSFFRSDLQFHSLIASIARVPQYAEGIRGLYLITFLTVHSRLALNADIVKMVSSRKEALVSEHSGILDAIRAHDKDKASQLIRKHIYGADDFWQLALSEQKKTYPVADYNYVTVNPSP